MLYNYDDNKRTEQVTGDGIKQENETSVETTQKMEEEQPKPAEQVIQPEMIKQPEPQMTAPEVKIQQRAEAVSDQYATEGSVQTKWCEAAYRTAPEENPQMYTPGINSQQYYTQQRPRNISGEPVERTRPRRFWGKFARTVSLALACVILSGATTYAVMEYRIRRGDITPVNQVVLGGSSTGRQNEELSTPIASTGDVMTGQEIYDMACTQVVSVQTDVPGMSGFFGQSAVSTVSGSGFIISDDGYILTNHHVIDSAFRGNLPLKVILYDGTEYEAKIIGFEESNDVAVIKIPATGLNAAVIGNSDDIRVGQTVYAVGNPFGELGYTMTDGIVSGLNRIVSVDNKSISTFQLNAAVNSGNSGGPVYDDRGEVVGIVTAKFMRNSVEGIGFAIPINDAIELAMDLVENGYITGKAYMGISVKTFTKAFAEFYSSVEGAYVVTVTPGSAADSAGIKVGDIITKLGDIDVTSEETLLFAKQKFKAGDTASLTVRRSGEDLELFITFDEDTSWLQQQDPQAFSEPQEPSYQETFPPGVIEIPFP